MTALRCSELLLVETKPAVASRRSTPCCPGSESHSHTPSMDLGVNPSRIDVYFDFLVLKNPGVSNPFSLFRGPFSHQINAEFQYIWRAQNAVSWKIMGVGGKKFSIVRRVVLLRAYGVQTHPIIMYGGTTVAVGNRLCLPRWSSTPNMQQNCHTLCLPLCVARRIRAACWRRRQQTALLWKTQLTVQCRAYTKNIS